MPVLQRLKTWLQENYSQVVSIYLLLYDKDSTQITENNYAQSFDNFTTLFANKKLNELIKSNKSEATSLSQQQINAQEGLEQNYYRPNRTGDGPTEEGKALDVAYEAEHGISFTKLSQFVGELISQGFPTGKPCVSMTVTDLEHWHKKQGLIPNEIKAAFDLLTLQPRPGVITPTVGISDLEVFPWRFGRSLSHLRRALVRLTANDADKFYFGCRHVVSFFDNLLSLLYNGKYPPVPVRQWMPG